MSDDALGWTHRIRTTLVAGLLVALPFGVTLGVIVLLVSRVDAVQPDRMLGVYVPGLGLAMVFAAVAILGVMSQSHVGRALVRWAEDAVERLPVFSGVYRGTKQVVETALAQGTSTVKAVVLVEWPRRGAWSIAFLTGDSFVLRDDGVRMVNVFVPSTPNPTTGFYFVCAEADLVRTSMSVEDSAKLIMSAGLVASSTRVLVPAPPGEALAPLPPDLRDPPAPSDTPAPSDAE